MDYELGPFRLDAPNGLLLRGSEPLALGRRAVTLLRALIETPGALVSKDVLIEAAWPGQAVEDSNLPVQIAALDAEINRRSKEDAVARRLMTIPGVGPITATAITALVPAAEGFRAGRDFAAWLGLTPLQKSTGGKQKLGAVSKRGERTIRRLLILGASAVIRQACLRGAPAGSWLGDLPTAPGAAPIRCFAKPGRAPSETGDGTATELASQMLPRKPKMLVTVALANKMARVVWALLVKGGVYKAPAVAA